MLELEFLSHQKAMTFGQVVQAPSNTYRRYLKSPLMEVPVWKTIALWIYDMLIASHVELGDRI